RGTGADRGAEEAAHPGGPRRGRLPAADLHQAGAGPSDVLLRADRAARLDGLREGELQGAVRGDRAGAGAPRQPVIRHSTRDTEGYRLVSLGWVRLGYDFGSRTHPPERHVRDSEP